MMESIIFKMFGLVLYIQVNREYLLFYVNTKYISPNVLKTLNLHECAARVKVLMFSTYEMKSIC